MRRSTFLLAVSTVSLLPTTGAWEITWNGPENNEHSQSGHGPSGCVTIDNPKGHHFKIDAQGEQNINMLLFTNSACSGEPAGMATESWSKEASRDLLGFKVVSVSSTTTSATTSTDLPIIHNATTSTKSTDSSSSQSASLSSSNSVKSTTTQTMEVTSSAATETSTSRSASSTTPSAATASPSNAAVRMAGSTGEFAKGLMGSIFGLAAVHWMI